MNLEKLVKLAKGILLIIVVITKLSNLLFNLVHLRFIFVTKLTHTLNIFVGAIDYSCWQNGFCKIFKKKHRCFCKIIGHFDFCEKVSCWIPICFGVTIENIFDAMLTQQYIETNVLSMQHLCYNSICWYQVKSAPNVWLYICTIEKKINYIHRCWIDYRQVLIELGAKMNIFGVDLTKCWND